MVIPRRHFDDWFEVTSEELADCAELVKVAKTLVEASYNPDGYNVGANIGDSVAAFYKNNKDSFLAIEPNPSFHEYLFANWSWNKNLKCQIGKHMQL